MGIYVRGDLRKASKWIGFAKTQLHRLKLTTDIISKVYRPAPGIGIHIKSVKGIDRIMIVASIGEKCGFSLRYVTVGKTVTFEVYNPKHINAVVLEFGDGEAAIVGSGDYDLTGSSFIAHTYENNGNYNVAINGIRVTKAIPAIARTISPSSRIYEETVIHTGGEEEVNIPWHEVPITVNSYPYASSLHIQSGSLIDGIFVPDGVTDEYQYSGGRIILTVPFQNWSPYSSIVSGSSRFILMRGSFQYDTYFDLPSTTGMTLKNDPAFDFGVTPELTELPNPPASPTKIVQRIIQSVPSEETVITVSGDFDSSGALSIRGWYGTRGITVVFSVYHYSCISKKTRAITV